MHIKADLGKCLAYANCVAAAPDVYDLEGRSSRSSSPTRARSTRRQRAAVPASAR